MSPTNIQKNHPCIDGPIYSYASKGDGIHLHIRDLKMSKLERMTLATDFPKELEGIKQHTEEECRSFGYMLMRSEQKFFVHSRSYVFPKALWANEKATQRLGMWDLITELRILGASTDFQETLAKSQTKAQLGKRGTVYDLPVSVQPTHTAGVISLSRAAMLGYENHDSRVQRFSTIAAKICDIYISEYFPEMKEGLYAEQWARNATMTLGDENNKTTTNIQFNVTAIEPNKKVHVESKVTNMKDSTQGKADCHVNPRDDPRIWKVRKPSEKHGDVEDQPAPKKRKTKRDELGKVKVTIVKVRCNEMTGKPLKQCLTRFWVQKEDLTIQVKCHIHTPKSVIEAIAKGEGTVPRPKEDVGVMAKRDGTESSE